MSIVYLCLYPEKTAPSQRFRFEHFMLYLAEAGFDVRLFPFFDAAAYSKIRSGGVLGKIWAVVFGFAKRVGQLPIYLKYDFIFVQRSATPIGPPVVEFLLAKVFGKKLVFDFDDAVWMHNDKGKSLITKYLRFHSNTRRLCRWAHRTCVGNEFLAEYARQFSPNVVVIPTCVDTEMTFNQTVEHRPGPVNVGWTGSFTTLPYLDTILPALERLDSLPEIGQITVIGNRNPHYNLLKFNFLEWREASEVADLRTLQIGLMPMENTDWARGKCGFKAIQYMALGIPPVVTPVGVNAEIVVDGETGFHADTPEAWVEQVSILAKDPILRAEMGRRCRERAVQFYSISANKAKFIGLFQI